MESIKSILQTVSERLRGLPATVKVVAGILIAIPLVTALLLWQHNSEVRSIGDDDAALASGGELSSVTPRGEDARGATERISFDGLMQSENPFLSRSQNDRRWLIATMHMLGESIASMNGIEHATVIIDEPKSQVGLGRANTRASASVTVVPTHPLTPARIDAIAELVAGAHASLSVDEVRIIDTTSGTAHRARSSEQLAFAQQLERQRAAEGRVRDEIAQWLAHIPDVSVDVRAVPSTTAGYAGRFNAVVGVPQTYFAQLHSDKYGTRNTSPRVQDIDEIILVESDRIRAQIEPLLAAGEDHDFAAGSIVVMAKPGMAIASRDEGAAPVDVLVAAESDAALAQFSLTQWLLSAFGVIALLSLVLIARKARIHHQPAHHHDAPQHVSHSTAPRTQTSTHVPHLRIAEDGVPFSFLQVSEASDILNLIQDEPSRTIALIVYNLPHHKASAILAGLPRAKQIEVARRVANMYQPNITAIREAEADLESRLSGRLVETTAA